MATIEELLEEIQQPDFGLVSFLEEAERSGHTAQQRYVVASDKEDEPAALLELKGYPNRDGVLTAVVQNGMVIAGREVLRTSEGRVVEVCATMIERDGVAGIYINPPYRMTFARGIAQAVLDSDFYFPSFPRVARAVGDAHLGGHVLHFDVVGEPSTEAVTKNMLSYSCNKADIRRPGEEDWAHIDVQKGTLAYGVSSGEIRLPFAVQGTAYSLERNETSGLFLIHMDRSERREELDGKLVISGTDVADLQLRLLGDGFWKLNSPAGPVWPAAYRATRGLIG